MGRCQKTFHNPDKCYLFLIGVFIDEGEWIACQNKLIFHFETSLIYHRITDDLCRMKNRSSARAMYSPTACYFNFDVIKNFVMQSQKSIQIKNSVVSQDDLKYWRFFTLARRTLFQDIPLNLNIIWNFATSSVAGEEGKFSIFII